MSLGWPVEPMKAVSALDIPAASQAREVVYEPKWDGFRALLWVTADGVRLQSRHGKDLSRYFPDLCQALAGHLAAGLVLDGEIIIWDQQTGRTSFTSLQRRFTVGRRVSEVATENPAHFVAFDVLRDARRRDLLDHPLHVRRNRLRRLANSAPPQLVICPQTSNERTAREWIADWTTAGIEGLVVKPRDGIYRPGGGDWIKIRTRQTTDYVIGGLTGTFEQPYSLLLGRYDERGMLRFSGQTHRIPAAQRKELARLRTMPFSGDANGHPWPCPLPASWAGQLADRLALPYLQVEPTLVAEVETDTAHDGPYERLRHRARLVRIRPDLQTRDVHLLSTQRAPGVRTVAITTQP
ncbi:ATP-dependent DNA ligase [Actinoplanes sp. TBRC 11911]|uniref:ATP-dependent DNA ligase n=1 Tax=Actinoplanes sp. TBRC 11911 TaxID=2729386 RepID=UPI00145DD64B|nr:ATP-dependent DNA ligase [Actinoplanes sp. TBRC 11911]NMO57698.1 ATP-dependent DNA ligase [Actinoplanes sp. TBRC 11911]